MNNSDKMSELFQRGLDEYDKGEYFEAHEAWEDLWSDYNFPDRKFVQGLIQLSVSFVHLGNGNLTGAKNLLKKCQQKFEDYNGMHRDINLSDLKSSIEAVEIVYSELNDCRDFDWDLVPVLKS
ncbi:MAG: hypothetical protein CMG22_01140 [Candidatus Marinimicrobia bacterium]|nr:hypothetical protein [Candidatus Neomarinimicrobiota bacterium]MAQ73832.1 hypothetical protein [Candidatus Neomarinimicrobiota bacterium]MBD67353.1 hypothetical protein [Candidatus Neomarinimicrobiota bacterium]